MKTSHTYLLLILISLVMLGTLEGLWLREVFQGKQEQLADKAERAFVGAINEMQDSLFSLYVDRLAAQGRVSNLQVSGQDTFINLTIRREGDTLTHSGPSHGKSPIESLSITLDKEPVFLRDSLPNGKQRVIADTSPKVKDAFEIFFLRDDKEKGEALAETKGYLSRYFGELKISTDSADIEVEDWSQLQQALSQRAAKDLAREGIYLDQITLTIRDSSTTRSEWVQTRDYFDVPTKTRMRMVLPHVSTYLFMDMLTEIGFAILLFVVISVAFAVIYRNMQRQMQLTALKNDFISNITHELKTPVTTVRVAIEALQDFDGLSDPQRTREYLDISRQELDRLNMLVDRVLRMSMFERDQLILKMEELELGQMLRSILSTMQLQFSKFGAEVDVQIAGGVFPLNGDRLHITSLIYNLLDNALKYGGDRPVIHVHLSSTSQGYTLVVRDQGIGIAPSYQKKIFEKFFRVPHGNIHNVKGHGLGLSYVAEVVRRHGGTISLESNLGEGSTFTIQLPV
ncbi:MAG: HAMP domain-containing sensor histidine kinase [Bacteroidota bacterium]